MLFDSEYSFKGSHADKVNKLTAEFSNDIKTGLFKRNMDVYLMAPLVGFLYGRKSDLDNDGKNTKIFYDTISREKQNLRFNFRLIVLLDTEMEPSLDRRLDVAFRTSEDEVDSKYEQLYEAYVRGGIDVLYEKLIDGVRNSDEYISRLYDFLEEFYERYNEIITIDDIVDLCRNVKE